MMFAIRQVLLLLTQVYAILPYHDRYSIGKLLLAREVLDCTSWALRGRASLKSKLAA